MLLFVLVLSASACVFGREVPKGVQPEVDERPPPNDLYEAKDLCLAGEIPSQQCQEKCEAVDANFEPYCYKHTRECLCRPKKTPKDRSLSSANEGETTATSPEPLDGPGSNGTGILHFIILFLDGGEEEVPEDSLEEAPAPSSAPVFGDPDLLWSKERLAMVLMAAVILALVVVELCIMCRKRRSARYLEHMFKTSPLDEKLAKSFKEDVRSC